MNTPICDFVNKYAASPALRLHMPGHKGVEVLGVERYDITEITGADVLYSAKGIIAESQRNAASLFGSGSTLYSCEGSSLSIRAMLYLAMLYSEDKSPTVLAARNAHKVFLSAAALLDFDIEWMYGDGVISCGITPEGLEEKLCSMEKKPIAFYITSPDYLGNVADIKGISEVCHKHGVLLLCDNAHGAYLHFLSKSMHPLDLGADMCCDSAHKTLPVLTGGGYLHISADAPALLHENAKRAMALFASTSPSYLILQSLDRCNLYLSEGYKDDLAQCAERINALKATLSAKGYDLIGDEPMKLTLVAKSYGYTGEEIAEILNSQNIVCEFADPDYVVLMFTPMIKGEDMDHLEKALLSIPKKSAIKEKAPTISKPKRIMSVREAVFSPSVVLSVDWCEGRTLASENVSCPPAIPIVVCGERIDKRAIEVLKYYGIKECRVIK